MPHAAALHALRARAHAELTEGILPYWMAQTPDERHGGFVGRIMHDGRVEAEAPKAAVLNTRILWAFAAAAQALGDARYRAVAARAEAYLVGHFWDDEHGGLYWRLDHTGQPLETKKQIYAQAFGVYALAAYYGLTGEAACLERAVALFRCIEQHSFDPSYGGYYEAYSRDWVLLDDVRLSDKDANEKKTMNTHLHLLEAYTALYRVWPNADLQRALRRLVGRFLTTILDPATGHLRLFFDERWTPKSVLVSYGHDIEASWLLTEAAAALGQPDIMQATRRAALRLAQVTLDEGRDADGALFNDSVSGSPIDTDRHWWPQAEAVVGFVNAYQLSGQTAYLDAALASWAYLDAHLIDRVGGEWFFRVAQDGTPYASENKVGPWKGPYHNTRVCLEVMARVDDLLA